VGGSAILESGRLAGASATPGSPCSRRREHASECIIPLNIRSQKAHCPRGALAPAVKLSLRDLAEMFLTRGFIFTYEAVREWEAKLTPALTEHLRRKRRVWARLRELFPGCQPRRPQSDAADDQGVAPATEERQEHGRSVGYVRSDPEGLATYYGRFHGSALKPVWRSMNLFLIRWLMRKHKRLPAGDSPHAFPRLRIVGDTREQPAALAQS